MTDEVEPPKDSCVVVYEPHALASLSREELVRATSTALGQAELSVLTTVEVQWSASVAEEMSLILECRIPHYAEEDADRILRKFEGNMDQKYGTSLSSSRQVARAH